MGADRFVVAGVVLYLDVWLYSSAYRGRPIEDAEEEGDVAQCTTPHGFNREQGRGEGGGRIECLLLPSACDCARGAGLLHRGECSSRARVQGCSRGGVRVAEQGACLGDDRPSCCFLSSTRALSTPWASSQQDRPTFRPTALILTDLASSRFLSGARSVQTEQPRSPLLPAPSPVVRLDRAIYFGGNLGRNPCHGVLAILEVLLLPPVVFRPLTVCLVPLHAPYLLSLSLLIIPTTPIAMAEVAECVALSGTQCVNGDVFGVGIMVRTLLILPHEPADITLRCSSTSSSAESSSLQPGCTTRTTCAFPRSSAPPLAERIPPASPPASKASPSVPTSSPPLQPPTLSPRSSSSTKSSGSSTRATSVASSRGGRRRSTCGCPSLRPSCFASLPSSFSAVRSCSRLMGRGRLGSIPSGRTDRLVSPTLRGMREAELIRAGVDAVAAATALLMSLGLQYMTEYTTWGAAFEAEVSPDVKPVHTHEHKHREPDQESVSS